MGRDENHRCRQCNDRSYVMVTEILDEEDELIGIEEEMVSEVMRWLEREISSPPVISGNQESCGPSMSDSSSTVMANVDTRGGSYLSFFFGAPAGPEFPALGIRALIEGLAGSQARMGVVMPTARTDYLGL